MEFYLVGIIVLPISIFLFLFYPQKLYYLTVFFIPFTGTALFKISFGSFEIEGLRASFILGGMGIVALIFSVLVKGKIKLNNWHKIFILSLSALALVVISSLIMPIIINGKIKVLDSYSNLLTYAEEEPLYFKFQYLTQTIYFLFGVIFCIYIILKNKSFPVLYKTLKLYLSVSIFVAIWGLFEVSSFYINIKYPNFLFNQNSMNQYGPLLLEGVPRLMSVALEPSILSQQLITTLPFLFWGIYYKSYYFSRRKDTIGLIVILVALILTISSTALVGLVLMVCIAMFTILLKSKVKSWFAFIWLVLVIVFFIATPYVLFKIIGKLDSYSGLERFKAINYGWDYFTSYPVLGIGWGVFPTWDIIICFLAGSGILGLLCFFMVLLLVFVRLSNIKSVFRSVDNAYPFLISVSQALILLLLVSQISGLIYHSQYFWFLLGLVIAVCCQKAEAIKLFFKDK